MTPRWQFGDVDLTDYPFMVDANSGVDHGTPDAATEVLASFLTDGDIEITSRRGNRTIVLPFYIEGSDQLELAEALARLEAECRKPFNELLVDPGDGFGPAMVFRTFETGSLVWNRDDPQERANFRSYTLTLRALSFAYSAEETVVEALGPPPPTPAVEVSVFDGASATGWGAAWNGQALTPATTTVTGRTLMGASSPTTAAQVTMSLQKIAAIDVSTTKYLVVDWAYLSGYPVGGLVPSVTGVTLEKVSEGLSPVAGDMRTIFKVPAGVSSLPDIAFSHTTTGGPGGGFGFADVIYRASSRTLYIDNIMRTDKVGGATGKQQLRSFTVGGSAPTTGSIEASHPTAALGDGAMVFTYSADGAAANGYTPQCSPFRLPGGPSVTPDATSLSGFSTNLDATDYFSIPAMGLPDGEYAVWAWLKSATAAPSVTWSVGPQLPIGTSIGDTVSRTVQVALGGSVWKPVYLGAIHLPLIDTGLAGSTLLSIGAVDGGSVDVFLAELLLFNTSIGQLTGVNLGNGTAAAGGPSRRLWIDSPSIGNNGLGALMRGHSADRSDSFSAYPSSFAPGVHRFPPGPMKAYTALPNTADAQVAFRYTKAWLHTAAE